jgi:hypothetical protein
MLGLTIDGLWATVDSPEAVPAVIEPAGKELMQRFKIQNPNPLWTIASLMFRSGWDGPVAATPIPQGTSSN